MSDQSDPRLDELRSLLDEVSDHAYYTLRDGYTVRKIEEALRLLDSLSDQSAETAQSLEDRIFDVLIAHQRIPTFTTPGANRCVGCDNLAGETDGSNSPRHARHLAALIAAAVSSSPEQPNPSNSEET